jgi:hypothetical protein
MIEKGEGEKVREKHTSHVGEESDNDLFSLSPSPPLSLKKNVCKLPTQIVQRNERI